MAQTSSWYIADRRMLEDRGALPTEEVDLTREYKATHEVTFLSSRLSGDVEGKADEKGDSEQGINSGKR